MEELFLRLDQSGSIDESGNIILAIYSDGFVQAVSKERFQIFFGDVADNPTYERLSGSHTFMWGDPIKEYTRTAEQLGYQEYFDEWKELGILS